MNLRSKREKAILEANEIKRAQEQMQQQEEYLRMQKRLAQAQALPAPNAFNNGHTHQYTPAGGGGASSGYTGYVNEHPGRSHVDVGELIKKAVEEAAKDFKLTVEAMQEQIDELWEYIRELEDE